MDTVNIAGYKFVSIDAPEIWRSVMLERGRILELKGSVVLATEGVNVFLAGSTENVDSFISFVREDKRFSQKLQNIEFKESFSESQPFRKLVVRVAKEIITMRMPIIKPEQQRAASVQAQRLKAWLDKGLDDDGREVVLIDTRNAFEVAIGTFEDAVNFDIERFSEFPDQVERFASERGDDLSDKTIVTFCTGGIRCEKAALFMNQLNLPRVFQLDGGILKYFEEAGGTHWRGECFVFDERVALDPQLKAKRNQYRTSTSER